jgi:preprotein translocase subunit SecE
VLAKATQFLTNVKGELKKVTWPTKAETFSSTKVVIVLVLAVTVFLWVVDTILSTAIRYILR